MTKASIVIPAHNEEKRIGKTLEKYIDFFKILKKDKKLDFEIIVVLNNCVDDTIKVVEKYKSNELKILNFERGGKGFAIKEGFKESLKGNSDFIGFVDADMSTPPKAFYDLVKALEKNNDVDGVIANRWDKRSNVEFPQTFFRKTLSRGYNLIVRSLFLFPYKDTQCGAKVFRKEILKKNLHKLVSSDWNFDVALLFCLKRESRANIKSIPTIWNDQRQSNVNIRRTPHMMFVSAIRLRLLHSPLKFVVMFYRNVLPERFKLG